MNRVTMHVTGWANIKVRVTDTKRRNWPWWDHHHWRWFQRSSGGWCPWSPWRAGQRWSWALPPSAWWSWLGPSHTSAHQTHLQSRSQPETHEDSCALMDTNTHTPPKNTPNWIASKLMKSQTAPPLPPIPLPTPKGQNQKEKRKQVAPPSLSPIPPPSPPCLLPAENLPTSCADP